MGPTRNGHRSSVPPGGESGQSRLKEESSLPKSGVASRRPGQWLVIFLTVRSVLTHFASNTTCSSAKSRQCAITPFAYSGGANTLRGITNTTCPFLGNQGDVGAGVRATRWKAASSRSPRACEDRRSQNRPNLGFVGQDGCLKAGSGSRTGYGHYGCASRVSNHIGILPSKMAKMACQQLGGRQFD